MSSNEITDIGVMAGRAYGTAPLSADMQYLETYTSSALNRKLKGIVRSGFYLGFAPVAGSGLNVVITSKNADGGQGAASIDVNAHQITVQHLADLTLPVVAGKTTRIVLEANYKLGVKTAQVDITSSVEAARVFAQDLSVALAPNQLEVCRVLVPTGTTQITQAMIVTNYRINRQVGITLDSIYTSDDELIAANLKGLKILKGMIDNNMVIANNGSDIHDKAMFRENIELDQLVNEKQLVASKNLADLPDVSKARENLELGTAAQADQQKNPLDMTPGALMAVGAFGLGAPSLVLDSKITSLADVSVTEQNAFWTLSGTFGDGPIDLGKTTQTLRGQLFNMRRKYDADASLLQLLVAQGGMMYWRSAGKVSGDWAWSGLSAGADKNGWRKVMDSASMTIADLVKAGAAAAGDNNDITSTSKLTNINTARLLLSKDLTVGSEVRAGYRFGVIRSTPFPAYMTFVRTDQVDGVAPASETSVFNIYGRLASATDDEWNGRALGGLSVSNMPHNGGKTILDARAASGNITAQFWLDGGNGSATFLGARGLTVAGGGGLASDGAGFFTSDDVSLQLRPTSKDKAYYMRGRKSDDTLHWYFGQSRDNNDAVTWGNSIPGTWLTLAGDGTAETNVSTMKLRNNVTVGGNLTVAGGADFTGPVNVLANGATAVGDLTNAALVVTGSNSDGSQGITVNSFAPSISFVDRDSNSAAFRWKADGNYLRMEVDNRDNGATWGSYSVLFSDLGHLSVAGGTGSPSRSLTIGNVTAGKGNMTGDTQIAAMAYSNLGADATARGIGFGAELSVGDGVTAQTLSDFVEFWGNSHIVNTNAAVTLMTSFRSYDKSSPSIATAYAFEGRQTARSGLSRWNLFMQGTAPNYMRGQTIIGGVDTSISDSYMALSVRGAAEVTDSLRVKGPAEFKNQVSLISANPYIDFNSSTSQLNDYDARILVDTTNATTIGQATMNIVAGFLNIGAKSRIQGQLIVDKDAHFDDAVYVRGNLFATSHINIGNIGTGAFAGTSGSLNIGDSDTGFVCPGDGILDFYANNKLTARFTPNQIYAYGRFVTEDANGLRIRPPGGSGIGMIHRFDGANYYMLVTNQNDPDGGFNSLRPFSFNATSGYVSMGHGVGIGGPLTVNSNVNANGDLIANNVVRTGGGQSIMYVDGNLSGPVWGGYLNNYISARYVTGVRFAGYKQGATWNGPGLTEESGYVITSVRNDNSDQYIDIVTARCVQYCINGGWYTAGFA